MDLNISIEVKNLTKVFKLSRNFTDRWAFLTQINQKPKKSSEFKALEDVSFKITRGRFVGIVGKNGSGKSTLLKLLSGELTPTSGSVEISGSVALLQLGLGFNPELTGLENIVFAATLLGFKGTQINEVVAKAIDFAEIGQFIDQPVKTYSSGMYSRLGFAIAINANPDILIADEVLAVGDARFAQKCLRHMRDLRSTGRTVILVSHDLAMVSSFCDEVIWIKDGSVQMHGETRSTLEHFKNYLYFDRLPNRNLDGELNNQINSFQSNWIALDTSRHQIVGEGGATINLVRLENLENPGTQISAAECGMACLLSLKFTIQSKECLPKLGFVIIDRLGQVIAHLDNEISELKLPALEPNQEHQIDFVFQWPFVQNGTYTISVGLQNSEQEDKIMFRAHDVLEIQSVAPRSVSNQHGIILIPNAKAVLRRL